MVLGLKVAVATAAWLLVAIGLYLVAAVILRAGGRKPTARDRRPRRRRTKTA